MAAAAEPAVGRAAARAKFPPPAPSPDSTVPESPSPPADTPWHHTPTKAHYSRGSAKEEVKEAGRGTQPRSKKRPSPRPPLPPSRPLKHTPKGDVPQRPPRVNCAHWTPSSAKRAALATAPSGPEEASIREAIPSK
uniref:Uncharacterized protein n=1 Tax=Pipistrellus kuhlii TaxID=59472 RepID=A0A7J8B0X1_PIPKU|nr:hypothetical protein mPipKuh1_007668 [Pipistrellus kuhlii]